MANQLEAIEHIVVLMLENRSFDHMLGFLYADRGNLSLSGQQFDGLTGQEANPGTDGKPVTVFQITSATPNAYLMPGADPGEGYLATNSQLFGTTTAPSPPIATNAGFVTDFASTLAWEATSPGWNVVPGTLPSDIMGMYTPAMLPVLSALAQGFAVCDSWFASAPTETMPNRAFACAATSQGHLDDKTKTFTSQSIFGLLSANNLDWRIYGYKSDPLTRLNFPDTTNAPEAHFGQFTDFQAAAAAGTLPPYTFLEPEWSSAGNSQHPNYDVAAGEALIQAAYEALRNGPAWNSTLFVVTYDEHGGCYDHVPTPSGATPPDACAGEFGFDFRRFGVRVPVVLVSPWIPAGTVFRAPAAGTPLDHTSVLATVERRFGLPALTARDGAAPDVGDALSGSTPRTDDPLTGVSPPAASSKGPASQASLAALPPSHLQKIHAELAAGLPVPGQRRPTSEALGALRTTADYTNFINRRVSDWKAAKAAANGTRSST
ncbi:MAG: alkaline phosphatase family protein [Acidimicrobiales bacterium]|jgi:phospholipase C